MTGNHIVYTVICVNLPIQNVNIIKSKAKPFRGCWTHYITDWGRGGHIWTMPVIEWQCSIEELIFCTDIFQNSHAKGEE